MKFRPASKLLFSHLILSLLIVHVVSIAGDAARERREESTDLAKRVDTFLGTKRGQIVLAVVLGVSGYLCCVIVPCCLGAASIFLLHCMNLLEYPDTPVPHKAKLDLDKVHAKKGEAESTDTPQTCRECVENQDSLAEQPGPPIIFNQAAPSEQNYFPVTSRTAYPYLPYQISYLTYGTHAAGPVYMNPSSCSLPSENPVYCNVRDDKTEVVYDNC